ncbi:MAG: S-methyl-5'-thioadenosine phosphorylase, partial [Chthonomonadaceae bacterium]|nr:S-methyl-5'-thioadenosine phosphorylase [Chthonomonadaceae bacterium]
NISLITDYDSGLVAAGEVPPCQQDEIYAVFLKNAERVKRVVLELVRRIPLDLDSPCHHALDHAKVG